ncbi:MAG: hypothetical protein ACMUIE_06550 [Thermoplasmatota archaeon]
MKSEEEVQAVYPPPSTGNRTYTQLAYLESHDDISGRDYAFVVFKEEKVDTGKWNIQISGKNTAGGSIDPEHPSLARDLEKAERDGRDHILFGFSLTPREGDPRVVENRLYFNRKREPTRIEVHLVTRNADGSAKEEKMARIQWPDDPSS